MWEYETEEGAHDLYMDTGEEIRFRVVDESFVDTSPTGPSNAEATTSSEELPKKEAPYTLVVRDTAGGAGCLPESPGKSGFRHLSLGSWEGGTAAMAVCMCVGVAPRKSVCSQAGVIPAGGQLGLGSAWARCSRATR